MTDFLLNHCRSFSFIFFILAVLYISGCSSSTKTVSNPKEWTVMVYLDGDDSQLESNAIIDFNEIEQGLYTAVHSGNQELVDSLNIIVLIDRYGGGSGTSVATEENGSDWSDARLYRIKPDNNSALFNSERLDDGLTAFSNHVPQYGEKNMGDPSTLSDFIHYSKETFPANHYALILWNHGGAAQKKSKSVSQPRPAKSICWDGDNNNDTLYLDELQQALEENFDESDKLDILGFDACLMATVEIAYELKSTINYMVASMNLIQADGWSYDRLFGSMTEATLDPESFATQMVQTYKAYIDATPSTQNYGESISVTDTSAIDPLVEKINLLATAMAAENKQSQLETIREESYNYYKIEAGFPADTDSVYYPYYDIYDLCERINSSSDFSASLKDAASDVMAAMTDAITYSYGDVSLPEFTGQSRTAYNGTNTSKGLSIFFSRGNMTYNSRSHYASQWWYTSEDTASAMGNPDKLFGHIDFCFSNSDGNVDGWRELMEYWYDNPDSETPSTF